MSVHVAGALSLFTFVHGAESLNLNITGLNQKHSIPEVKVLICGGLNTPATRNTKENTNEKLKEI